MDATLKVIACGIAVLEVALGKRVTPCTSMGSGTVYPMKRQEYWGAFTSLGRH